MPEVFQLAQIVEFPSWDIYWYLLNCMFLGLQKDGDYFKAGLYAIVDAVRCMSAKHTSSKGSSGGARVRALASHQHGPGSNPYIDAIPDLSVVSSFLCSERFFSLINPDFPSPKKPTLLNSNLTRNRPFPYS